MLDALVALGGEESFTLDAGMLMVLGLRFVADEVGVAVGTSTKVLCTVAP
jgi:hypothetical protein